MRQRHYTDAEKGLVRRLYTTHAAADIAERIGLPRRAAKAVYQLAVRIGLTKWPHWPPAVLDQVRLLHAEGLPDAAIARRMCDVFAPGSQGRDQVKHIRRVSLGLPCIPDAEAKRRAVRNQLATLGLSRPTELRTRAFRLYALENGWPADLRPREVQILNALAVHGPQTGRELAERIGMATGPFRSGKRRVLLSGNGPGGTYTASLAQRGLVMRQPRTVARVCRDGVRRARQIGSVYMLTAAAVAIIERRLHGEHERQHESQAE